MKPKIYNILGRCIEDGLKFGYQRAFKHTDSPTEEQILNTCLIAILDEIFEHFSFDDDELNACD